MSFLRIRRFWKSVPARLQGVHVDPTEDFAWLSTKAAHPVNDSLEASIKAARGIPKPRVERKTPKSQFLEKLEAQRHPAEPKAPVDFEKLPT